MDLSVKNLNNINYLKNVFKDLKKYQINCDSHEEEFNNIINNYELNKQKQIYEDLQEQENNENGIPNLKFKTNNNLELELNNNLENLKEHLKEEILLIELMNATNDWNLNIDIDELFYAINKKDFFKKFANLELQQLIISRYHDLLLKKIIIDYQLKDETYLKKYENLEAMPLLNNSIKKFCEYNGITLTNTYDLKIILDEILDFFKSKETINENTEIMEVNKTFLMPILPSQNIFYILKNNYRKYLEQIRNKLILEKEYIFSDSECDRMKYDPKLKYLGDNAVFVLQIIGKKRGKKKDFRYADFSEIPVYDIDFTDVKVVGATFHETEKFINLDKVYNKDLSSVNLKESKLDNINFDGFTINGANLAYTNAVIDIRTLKSKNILKTILDGCFIIYGKEDIELIKKLKSLYSHAIFIETNGKLYEAKEFEYLGKNAKEIIELIGIKKAYNKDFSDIDFKEINLEDVDFTNVKILNANLKNTNAKLIPEENYKLERIKK